MQVGLNLINQQTKKEIAKDIHLILVINNFGIIVLALAVAAIFLFCGQAYLNYRVEKIEKIDAVTSYDAEIANINRKINQVELVRKDYVKWSRVLVNLLSAAPEGNSIDSLMLDKKNNKAVINGRSETRDNFLELKDGLEHSDLISDLNSPISNILYQKDINFNLEATLNLVLVFPNSYE
ncbi:MAG: hypothetical protein ABIJ91_04635 [Candidatus Kuenenbacteria bacterium]